MKKRLILLAGIFSIALFSLSFIACSDDIENGIIGTKWKESETGFNLVIKFVDEDKASLSNGLLSKDGTYTYDETTQKGILKTESSNSPFSINGDILICEKTKFHKQ